MAPWLRLVACGSRAARCRTGRVHPVDLALHARRSEQRREIAVEAVRLDGARGENPIERRRVGCQPDERPVAAPRHEEHVEPGRARQRHGTRLRDGIRIDDRLRDESPAVEVVHRDVGRREHGGARASALSVTSTGTAASLIEVDRYAPGASMETTLNELSAAHATTMRRLS